MMPRNRIVAPLLVVALSAGAVGCGSAASGSSSTRTSTQATAGAAGTGRRAQLAACLRKQGVTPPRRPSGQQGSGGGLLFGGGGGGAGAARARNPKLAAALRKCGFTPGQGNGRVRAGSPRFRQALADFVACMRRNGYVMPAPNTSGNGPVFDPSKVNRNDPKFVSAAQKCQGLLRVKPA
jgi:hypothetical protein